jgi:hypothetical protein
MTRGNEILVNVTRGNEISGKRVYGERCFRGNGPRRSEKRRIGPRGNYNTKKNLSSGRIRTFIDKKVVFDEKIFSVRRLSDLMFRQFFFNILQISLLRNQTYFFKGKCSF